MSTPTILNVDSTTRVKKIKKLHEQVKLKIEKQNVMFQKQANKSKRVITFSVGDLVWIKLKMERFTVGLFGKLKPKADAHLELLR